MRRPFLVFLIVLIILVLWIVGAPPRWWLNLTKAVDLSDPVATGASLVEKYECQRCHRLNGQGALKAPNLDEVAQRLDSVSLRLWLQNPKNGQGQYSHAQLQIIRFRDLSPGCLSGIFES